MLGPPGAAGNRAFFLVYFAVVKLIRNGSQKIGPKCTQIVRFLKKDELGSDLGQVSEQCPEKVPFRAVPGVENDAPVDTGAQFPLFADIQNAPRMEPKGRHKGAQIRLKTPQGRSKSVLKKRQKNECEI